MRVISRSIFNVVFLLFFVLSFSGCNESELVIEDYPRINLIDSTITSAVVAEREDLGFYCCLDSVRHRFIFLGRAKEAIYSLKDMNASWEVVCNPAEISSDYIGETQYVHLLPDGNYMIYAYVKDGCSQLWKYWPESNKLEKVFTFRNKYQSLKWFWGIEYNPDQKVLYVSEYGNSLDNPTTSDKTINHGHLGYKAGATIIWQSKDNGETWSKFFDFSKRKDIVYERFHIHAMHYDKYQKRLYVSTGDFVDDDGNSNKKLFWTDNGTNWYYRDWKYYWGKSNNAYSHGQLVSMFSTKDYILAGGDDFNNCIYRINKSDTISNMQMERVFYYNPDVRGKITQYTGWFKQLSNGLIVTFLGNGDGDGYPRQTRLVGTYDGLHWKELYAGQLEIEDENLFQWSNFDEVDGNLYFTICQRGNDQQHIWKFVELSIE